MILKALKNSVLFLPLMALVLVPALGLAQIATTTPPAAPSTPAVQLVAPEFNLTADGIILVRGLVITDLAPGTIRATFIYGNFQLPVVIQTTTATNYWDREATSQLLERDLRVGDVISFSGIVTSGANAAPAVIASVVRDWTPAAVPNRVGGDTGTGTDIGTGTVETGTTSTTTLDRDNSDAATSSLNDLDDLNATSTTTDDDNLIEDDDTVL